MKKLVIFDLDGTLIDTLDDLRDSVNYALKEYGYPLKDREHIRQSIGNGVAMLVARCIPEGKDNPNYGEVLKKFKAHYSIHSEDQTHPYKGIIELLTRLKALGYKLAVCTNKINALANTMIKAMFPGAFEMIQGDDPSLKNKPSPDMIDKILNDLGCTKEEAIYVGDTNVDMQTAINSKLDYYLITYGYRTKEELLVQCPNSPMLDSLDELYEELKKQRF